MNKPKDINDYTQCVKISDDQYRIFCVECNRWQPVVIQAQARVEWRQSRKKAAVIDTWDYQHVCQGCEADIGYLLSAIQKAWLMKLVRF